MCRFEGDDYIPGTILFRHQIGTTPDGLVCIVWFDEEEKVTKRWFEWSKMEEWERDG